MKAKSLFNIVMFIGLALAGITITSCSSDDDDSTSGGSTSLAGKSFSRTQSGGGSTNGHTDWEMTTTWTLKFESEKSVTLSRSSSVWWDWEEWWDRDLPAPGSSSSSGSKDGTYKVSGNTVTIEWKDSSPMRLSYPDGDSDPVDWTGKKLVLEYSDGKLSNKDMTWK